MPFFFAYTLDPFHAFSLGIVGGIVRRLIGIRQGRSSDVKEMK